ncbi:hypothetical protein JKP88DRAFT_241027 [Tribonema minus]|uniref:C2H2-type domain-containing protein n=1 Tax=Tribonema minus TaxID=303371 RepID=A0A835Z4R2_9STRA|nr:hypothetical protein JKP88DRAFT_241027 [Tribonema minus]
MVTSRLACPDCPKTFPWRAGLNRHRKATHAYVYDPRIPHVTILPKPSDDDLAHAAGFIEGDGCISIQGTTPSVSAAQTIKKKELLHDLLRIFGVGVITKCSDETLTRTEKWEWRCTAAESIAVCKLLHEFLVQKARVAKVFSTMEPIEQCGRNTPHNRACIAKYNTVKKTFMEIDELDAIACTGGRTVNFTDLVNRGFEFRDLSMHYIAGFFEAEGCIVIRKLTRGKAHTLAVTIAQKELYILYLVLAKLKIGQVNFESRGCGKYSVNGSFAIDVLKALQPFLRSPAMKEQVRIVLEDGVNATSKLELVQYKAKR